MKPDILDLKFKSEDLNKELSIREFFFILMKLLWIEQDGFDSKRPFGNSSWDVDVIVCLIKNNIIKGRIGEDGYLEEYDNNEVNKVVINQILKPLFGL